MKCMGLSKRAKRGIAVLSHLQWKTKGWKYHAKRMMTTIDLNKVAAPVVQAGLDAIQKMRENANELQKLSEGSNNPIPAGTEGGAEHSVPVQPEDGKEGAEGPDDSASGGAR